MKRVLTMLLIAMAATLTGVAVAGTTIKSSALPKAAQEFLSKYFPGDNIKKAEQDQGRRGIEYEVDLASGAEVEFNSDGSWKKVEAAKGKAVPSAIVPTAISKYVSTNHSGQTIKEISRRRGGYQVELSGGTKLHLSEEGKAITPGQGGGNRGNRNK